MPPYLNVNCTVLSTQYSVLTGLAELADEGPGVLADALEGGPELLALRAVVARVGVAARLAVLDDLAEVHAHVRVDVQHLAVHHQAPEAPDQPLRDGALLEQVPATQNQPR